MRILMLGNSFTFANNMPKTLANLIDAEVVQHTRGGARLAEQLNPDTKMGGMTQAALENEKWDYVILQEMSNGPITSRESFLKNTALLCERIRVFVPMEQYRFCMPPGLIRRAASSWNPSAWTMMRCIRKCMMLIMRLPIRMRP